MSNRRQAIKLAPGPQGLQRTEVERVQRERLTKAMAVVASTVGYEEATVERVIADAGISRRTFYELFEDRESCFLAMYDDGMDRVLLAVTDAYLDGGDPADRIERAIAALLEFLASEPDLARACVVEVFAAGPRARERRAEVMERLAHLVQHALNQMRGDTNLDRLSAHAMIGAIHELIYLPIDRRDSATLRTMTGDLISTQVAPLVATDR